jgi:hypothetical protein
MYFFRPLIYIYIKTGTTYQSSTPFFLRETPQRHLIFEPVQKNDKLDTKRRKENKITMKNVMVVFFL